MKLGDLARPVIRHLVLVAAVFASVFGFFAGAVLTRPPVYESTAVLLVKLGREFMNEAETGDVPVLSRAEVINTEIEILRTRGVLEGVVSALGPTRLYPELAKFPRGVRGTLALVEFVSGDRGAARSIEDLAVVRFEESLRIEAVPDTQVIRVTFRHPDPALAARAVNLLVDLFMERHLWAFGQARTTTFLEEKVAAYQRKLDAYDERIRAFLEANDEFLSERSETSLTEHWRKLNSDLDSVAAEITAVHYQLSQLVRQRRSTSKYERGDLRADLDREIMRATARLRGLESKRRTIGDDLEKYDTKRAELPHLRKVYTGLMREARSAEQLVRTYSTRLEEARISEEMDRQKIANITVLQEGLVTGSPVGLGWSIGLLVGGLAAGVLALVAALVVETRHSNKAAPVVPDDSLWAPVERVGSGR